MKKDDRTRLRKFCQTVRRSLQVDYHRRIGAELVDQTLDAIHKVLAVELPGAQVEDIGADIANGTIEIVDCLLNACGCL